MLRQARLGNFSSFASMVSDATKMFSSCLPDLSFTLSFEVFMRSAPLSPHESGLTNGPRLLPNSSNPVVHHKFRLMIGITTTQNVPENLAVPATSISSAVHRKTQHRDAQTRCSTRFTHCAPVGHGQEIRWRGGCAPPSAGHASRTP